MACYEIYRPVCAYPFGCSDVSCAKTYSNDCAACSDLNIEEYTSGECQYPQEGYCDPNNRAINCPAIYSPVCAYPYGCSDVSCAQTFDNGCTACGDPNIWKYTIGECPSSQVHCDPNNRPMNCPAIYSPVCAYPFDCFGVPCASTYPSDCDACADPTISSYLPGECPVILLKGILDIAASIEQLLEGEWTGGEEWQAEEGETGVFEEEVVLIA